MEDLTAWVTSEEEASAVEREIRSKLLDSPRISFSEGSKKFAEHLLCDDERANFNLLMVGFCRRFSSLAEDCYKNVDERDMKARFSCSWMKVMSNFQIGKQSQERIILERLIKNGPTSYQCRTRTCIHLYTLVTLVTLVYTCILVTLVYTTLVSTTLIYFVYTTLIDIH